MGWITFPHRQECSQGRKPDTTFLPMNLLDVLSFYTDGLCEKGRTIVGFPPPHERDWSGNTVITNLLRDYRLAKEMIPTTLSGNSRFSYCVATYC